MKRCRCTECRALDRLPLQGIPGAFQLAFEFDVPASEKPKPRPRQPRTVFRVYFRNRPDKLWGARGNVLLVTGRDELDRILGRKTPIAVAWEKAKLHRCSGCGRRGPWDTGWSWRGEWRAIDDGGPIQIACSNECREMVAASNRFWSPYEPLPSRDRAKRKTVGMSETERAAVARERRTVPLAPDWKGPGWCRWCGGKIDHKRARQMNWHPDCKSVWMLHYDRHAQTDYLVDRDGLDCVDCRRGGRWWRIDLVLATWTWEAFPYRVPPARRQFGDRAKYPADLALRKIDGVIIGLYTRVEYRLNCGELEVDHDVPLWKIWHLPDDERKPYYGPKNLRLRCKDCHKAKSKREAAERSRLRSRGPINLDDPDRRSHTSVRP